MHEWLPDIALDFFKDILERGRYFRVLIDRKRESVGLPGAVIRVLPEDDDLYLVEKT